MSFNYTPEFKKKIVRLREEEGRTIKITTAEYGVSKASIFKWCCEFSKECQSNPLSKAEYDNIRPHSALGWIFPNAFDLNLQKSIIA